MKIGVLGSGDVAKALGAGFLKHGHQVTLGTRDATKLAVWTKSNPGSRVGSFAEAAASAEVIVLAVKGSVATEALKSAGESNLANKPVVDATNPIADAPPVHGVLTFFTDQNQSLMERLQRQFPNAHFVKAFNSVGCDLMVNPKFKAGKPTMFICGNDETSKRTVEKILDQFGWETADMGRAESARAIEPLCMLWCIRGLAKNQWNHAFKLLVD
ncbi:MAG: NAD(P)-binding domain-containing protein [Tepidisphaeraceae bacterium]